MDAFWDWLKIAGGVVAGLVIAGAMISAYLAGGGGIRPGPGSVFRVGYRAGRRDYRARIRRKGSRNK